MNLSDLILMYKGNKKLTKNATFALVDEKVIQIKNLIISMGGSKKHTISGDYDVDGSLLMGTAYMPFNVSGSFACGSDNGVWFYDKILQIWNLKNMGGTIKRQRLIGVTCMSYNRDLFGYKIEYITRSIDNWESYADEIINSI